MLKLSWANLVGEVPKEGEHIMLYTLLETPGVQREGG